MWDQIYLKLYYQLVLDGFSEFNPFCLYFVLLICASKFNNSCAPKTNKKTLLIGLLLNIYSYVFNVNNSTNGKEIRNFIISK